MGKSNEPLQLVLNRFDATSDRTIGEMTIGGVHECFTVEDCIRPAGEKVPGKTAIPAGRYRVLITFSNRFQKHLPELLNVPNFTGVRIHSGNTAADTEGCLIVGRAHEGDAVLESRLALGALQPKIIDAIAAGREVWITISNPAVTA
jgi:hypothetical protein